MPVMGFGEKLNRFKPAELFSRFKSAITPKSRQKYELVRDQSKSSQASLPPEAKASRKSWWRKSIRAKVSKEDSALISTGYSKVDTYLPQTTDDDKGKKSRPKTFKVFTQCISKEPEEESTVGLSTSALCGEQHQEFCSGSDESLNLFNRAQNGAYNMTSPDADQHQVVGTETVEIHHKSTFVEKANGEICRTESQQSIYSSSSQDYSKNVPSHHLPASPTCFPKSTTIKRAGEYLWHSVDGESFEEVKGEIDTHQDILTIWKTGKHVWQSTDKRQFEKLPHIDCHLSQGYAAHPAAAVLHIKNVAETRESSVNNYPVEELSKSPLSKLAPKSVTQPCGVGLQPHADSCNINGHDLSSGSILSFGSDLSLHCMDHYEPHIPIIDKVDVQNSVVESGQLNDISPSPPESNAGSEKTQELNEQKSENLPSETEASCNKDVKVPKLGGYQLEGLIDKLYVDPDERFRGLRKPEDFEDVIDGLAEKILKDGKIQSAIYIPSPLTYYEVLVQGHGVSRITKRLKKYVAKHFPQYTITVSEASIDELSTGYATLLTNRHPFHVNICQPEAGAQDTKRSVVTAFFKGKRLQRDHIVFALSVFHGMGTYEEMRKLRQADNSDRDETRGYCKQVMGRTGLEDLITISEPEDSHQPNICVRDSPFIAYSHHVKSKARLEPFQTFLMDFVLLPIDAEALYPPILSEHPAEFRFQTCTINVGGLLKEIRIAGYIDIRNREDVELLAQSGIAIFVANTKGRIVQQVRPFHRNGSHSSGAAPPEDANRYIIADHIAIITEDELIPGTSGSPVMVYNEQEDELYILGALVGIHTRYNEVFKRPIYHVAALAPGLRQLELLYPDHLEDLQLLPTPGSEVIDVQQFVPSDKEMVESNNHGRDAGYGTLDTDISQPNE